MYSFHPIDLTRHSAQCIAFRRDSFICSFGDDTEFIRDCGPDGAGYLTWLQELCTSWPPGCVHMWAQGEIIGQIEMRVLSERRGYIHLFYLAASARGTGAGDALHAYAIDTLRHAGATHAYLSVSPSNPRAVAYYTKYGWKDLGPRVHQPPNSLVHRMALELDPTQPTPPTPP